MPRERIAIYFRPHVAAWLRDEATRRGVSPSMLADLLIEERTHADTTPSTAEPPHVTRQATPRRQPAPRKGHAQRLADSLIEQDPTPYYDHKVLEWWNATAEECGFHIGEKRQAIHGGHFTDPDMHAAALRLLDRLDRE